MTFPLFKGILVEAVSVAALQVWAVTVGVWGTGWVPVLRALVTRSLSIAGAEEDPAVSQEQLEMTGKAETGKCDKLMD